MHVSKGAWFALSFLALSACEAPKSDAADANASGVAANLTPTTQVVRTEKPLNSVTSDNAAQLDVAFLIKGIWMSKGTTCGTPTGDFWSFDGDANYTAPGTYGKFELVNGGSKIRVQFDDEMSGKGNETLSIKRDEDNLIINGIEYHRCKDTRRKV